jgi:hypothetical protein
MLDTNERLFNGSLDLTLIDPALGEVRGLFGEHGAGDILFIGSGFIDSGLMPLCLENEGGSIWLRRGIYP